MNLARLTNNWIPSFPSWAERFFEGDLTDWNSSNFAGEQSTLPAVNLKENDNEYQIEVAAPGLKKGDFKINFKKGSLTISSEKKEEKEDKEGEKVTRKEFNYMSFQRTFNVPENLVNTDKISAKYVDGILHVKLPKREEVKPKPAKEIEIL